MDAIDLVLTEFDGDVMRDVCTYSRPYSKYMQQQMDFLRQNCRNKTKKEIEQIPDFDAIHDAYITQIAECINEMCIRNHLDKADIHAIGFHGKTLDHNPPSQAVINHTKAYTLQIGSGQMLADLTGIPVIYDFRSAYIMTGLEGAPLIAPHNAHIAKVEGDGCYYNGGNTSNFAWIKTANAQISTDSGPCNEYIDAFVRLYTPDSYDKDGKYGKNGRLNKSLLQDLFDIGRAFYEQKLPKSGDPQYYKTQDVFNLIKQKNVPLCDAVHTLEYFAAYIAAFELTLTPSDVDITPSVILFGGGWKNPVVRHSFDSILSQKGYILPEHMQNFNQFFERVKAPFQVQYSAFGQMMEARLFADLARYRLENKVWPMPEVVASHKNIVSGIVAHPGRFAVCDKINRAAKGWQRG